MIAGLILAVSSSSVLLALCLLLCKFSIDRLVAHEQENRDV